MNFCPLGACALAGTGLPIDRFMTAEALEFTAPMRNRYVLKQTNLECGLLICQGDKLTIVTICCCSLWYPLFLFHTIYPILLATLIVKSRVSAFGISSTPLQFVIFIYVYGWKMAALGYHMTRFDPFKYLGLTL